jgi:hypothetical protein
MEQRKSEEPCFLGVYDIPLSGNSDHQLVAQAHSVSDLPVVFAKLESQGHDAEAIRVYIDEANSNEDFKNKLREHSCNLGVIPDRDEYNTGFLGVMSLLRPHVTRKRWYLVDGIDLNPSLGSSSAGLWKYGSGNSFESSFPDLSLGLPKLDTRKRVMLHEGPCGQCTGQ